MLLNLTFYLAFDNIDKIDTVVHNLFSYSVFSITLRLGYSC